MVGAGPAGMAAAKQILDIAAARGEEIPFAVFERRDEVGGLWQYEEPRWAGQLSSEPFGEHGARRYRWQSKEAPSAMYEGLR